MAATAGPARRWRRLFVLALGLWLLASTAALYAGTRGHPAAHAVIGMAAGLVLLWVAGCGSLMYLGRDRARALAARIPLDWRATFWLFATALALLEEAIATAMTNLAPRFGVPVGHAYITASTNYLDVVAFHSVVAFVSLFAGWAWLLSRYAFSPFAAFVLFGLLGTAAEGQPLAAGQWVFVYGLMVYLPAYCVPADRGARRPRWWHYPLAVAAPAAFLGLVPVALLVHLLAPHHPDVHFPPLRD